MVASVSVLCMYVHVCMDKGREGEREREGKIPQLNFFSNNSAHCEANMH